MLLLVKQTLRSGTVCYVMCAICRWEKEQYVMWSMTVDEACAFNLDQPIIKRNTANDNIKVNFDPTVSVQSQLALLSLTLSRR